MSNKEDSIAEVHELPQIVLTWDDDGKEVGIKFKAEDFPNWDFVIAMLNMATKASERQQQMQEAAAIQQMAIQQTQSAQLAAQIRNNGIVHG